MFIVFGMSSFYIYIEIYLKYDHAYEFHGHQFPEVVSPVAMLVVVTLIAKTTRISQNLNDFNLIIQSLRGGFGGGGLRTPLFSGIRPPTRLAGIRSPSLPLYYLQISIFGDGD